MVHCDQATDIITLTNRSTQRLPTFHNILLASMYLVYIREDISLGRMTEAPLRTIAIEIANCGTLAANMRVVRFVMSIVRYPLWILPPHISTTFITNIIGEQPLQRYFN